MGVRACAVEGVELKPEFWRNRRVFVTGHTGFKGSWLCLWLQSLGAEITGYALKPPTSPSLFEVAGVAQGMTSIEGDVRDLKALGEAMRTAAPEIVIHMAAQPLVRYSYENPIETYETNVMGTVSVLEAVRTTSSVRAVVNVTTDKCYENREWVWGYRENDPMGGYDPYSSSKGCAELVSAAYRSSFFNPADYEKHRVAVATVRAGNVIGGGDWAADRLIPDTLSAFSKGQPVSVRNPRSIRPWQHVLEPLNGYLILAERLYEDGVRYAEAWNFGPADEDARPVGWIVKEMAGLWGGAATYQFARGDHRHEAAFLKLDISKARSLLGWSPKWSLAVALSHIVDWHRAFLASDDMRSKSISQISEFQST